MRPRVPIEILQGKRLGGEGSVVRVRAEGHMHFGGAAPQQRRGRYRGSGVFNASREGSPSLRKLGPG